jgi:hypothetical protein
MVLERVQGIRKNENKFIFSQSKIRTTIDMLSNGFPLVIIVFLFGIYVAQGYTLTSDKAYSVLAYINLMLGPLKLLMFSLFTILNMQASLRRI